MSFRGFVKRVYRKEIQRLLRDKVAIENPQKILQLIKHDSGTNFRHYGFVKELFCNALKSHKYRISSNDSKQVNSINILKQTLSSIAKYPMFQLDQQGFKTFNKLINDNIHQKDNHILQACLVFLITSDPHVQSSQVYIQFIKFYVKDNTQLIKSQLSIDFHEQNLLNTIKLFFLRIFQRGFMPRQPTYVRELYIDNHTLVLNKMVGNKTLLKSLMLKKVNHENLMKVKEFYETQMKENLYHQKNIVLIGLLVHMLPYLCKSFQLQIKLIESDCKYLRELYLKLFLVINRPELKNCILFYDMVQEDNNKTDKLLSQFLKKVVAQYQSIESFKFNRESEQNDEQSSKSEQQRFDIENEELFMIIKNQQTLKLRPQVLTQLITQFAFRIQSAVVFKKHFHQLIKLINQTQKQNLDQTQILKTLSQSQTFELLDLRQSVQVSTLNIVTQNDSIKIALSKSIQKKDILHVGNEQILSLLKLYLNLSLLNPLSDFDHYNRQQALIKFILRFLSDHHQSLPFDSIFQQILETIVGINQSSKNSFSLLEMDFNDPDENYPNTILHQLQNHLRKHNWKIKNQTLKSSINLKLNI